MTFIPATSSSDPAEIKKFNQLADQWWDLTGPFKTLHHINPARMAFIMQHIQLANKKVADIGCGAGILTEALARERANVTGIDLAGDVIKVAQKHAQHQGLIIDYQQSSIEHLAARYPNCFDVVICMEMLEHVPTPQLIVEHCANLAKPEGWIFFSTINRNLKSYLGAIIAAEYILQLLPKHTHNYNCFIKPAELATWARVAQLNVVAVQGLHYVPWLNNQSRLGSDISINYLMACQKTKNS
ncbi:MAG: bifunctional 3-demethylubiquinone 3-O-methyltransferase/2-octaprenyl-6-hydroxy phenol methylase [Gammaproteobacteria bacterium]